MGGGTGEGESSSGSGRASSTALTAHLGAQPAWLLPGLSPGISAPASVSLQPAAQLPELSFSVPTAGLRHGRVMQLGRTGSIMGERIQIKSAFMKSMPQHAWKNAEKPLSTPEDALAFLKPAGTASLCKPTCSTLIWLLLQGSSSPCLPLQMSPAFSLCVGTAIGAG